MAEQQIPVAGAPAAVGPCRSIVARDVTLPWGHYERASWIGFRRAVQDMRERRTPYFTRPEDPECYSANIMSVQSEMAAAVFFGVPLGETKMAEVDVAGHQVRMRSPTAKMPDPDKLDLLVPEKYADHEKFVHVVWRKHRVFSIVGWISVGEAKHLGHSFNPGGHRGTWLVRPDQLHKTFLVEEKYYGTCAGVTTCQ